MHVLCKYVFLSLFLLARGGGEGVGEVSLYFLLVVGQDISGVI